MTTYVSRSSLRRTLCMTTALAGGVLLIAAPGRAQIVPTGPTFPGGQTDPTIGAPVVNGGGGLDLGIQTNANRSIINWSTYNIGANDSVNYTNGATNPANRVAILNRVIGPGGNNPSQSNIQGALTSSSNISVYLINPTGILFGAGAAVNVGGLVASSLDIADADFLDGNDSFSFSASGLGSGGIQMDAGSAINGGEIVAFIGHFVNVAAGATVGATTAPENAVFVAASEVSMTASPGSPLALTISEGTAVPNALVLGGTVEGQNVYVGMASQAGVVDSVLSIGGVVTATTATATDRGIVLAAGTSASGITVDAGGDTTGNAKVDIAGSLNADDGGTAANTASVEIRALDAITATGTITADDEITIASTRGDVNASGAINAGDDVTLAASTAGIVTASNVTLGGDYSVTAGDFGGGTFSPTFIGTGNDFTITDTAGGLTLGTLTAPGTLTVNALNGGQLSLNNGALTSTTEAVVLNAASGINVVGGPATVDSATGQTLTGPITLGDDLTLASSGGGAIAVNGTVDGANDLIVNTTGATSFASAIGAGTALASLTTNAGGTTAINGGVVTTTGAQTFGDAVALGADTLLTGGSGTFVEGVDGNGFDLTLNFGGTTVLSGSFTEIDNLATGGGGTTSLSGTITTTGGQTYGDGVTLAGATQLTSSGNGAIAFGSTVDGGNTLAVTTSGLTSFAGAVGATNALTSVITNGGGTTALNGGTFNSTGIQGYADDVTLGTNTVVTSSGGAVGFGGTVAGGANDLLVNAAGLANFGGAVTVDALGVDANNVTFGATNIVNTLAADIATGGIAFTNTPSLTIGTVGGIAGVTAAAGNVVIASGGGVTLTQGVTATAGNVDLAASGGTLSGSGVVSGNEVALLGSAGIGAAGARVNTAATALAADGGTGGVFLSEANAVTLRNVGARANSSAGAYDLVAGGAVTVEGIVTSTGGNVSLATTAGDINLAATGRVNATSGTISLNAAGAIDATAGAVLTGNDIALRAQDFRGAIFDAALLQEANNLAVTDTAGGLQLASLSAANRLDVDVLGGGGLIVTDTLAAGGIVDLQAAAITFEGVAVSGSSVIVGAPLTLGTAGSTVSAGGAGTVLFSGTINGGQTLGVTASGGTTFTGAVGTTTALTALTVTGPSAINGGAVTTTGAQSFSGLVTLGADTILTGGSGSFGAGVAGNDNDLILNFGGVTALNGSFTGIEDLATGGGGTTSLNGNITTSGSQTFGEPVTLAGNTQLTSSGNAAIAFGGTVNGGSTLAVTTSGATSFAAAVGGTTALTSLTTNGGGTTTLNVGVTTTGAQTYSDNVVLGSAVTLTAGGASPISLQGITGANALTVNTAGQTSFNGAVSIASLATDAPGTTNINTASIATTGDQTYGDNVALGVSTTLSGEDLSFASISGAGNDLTLTFSGATALTGPTVLGVRNLTSNGGGTTSLAGAITTTGAQLYDDAVSLAGNTVLNGTNGTFVRAITGGGFDLDLGFSGLTIVGAGASGLDTLAAIGGGTTQLNGTISTSGSQTYADAVTLASTVAAISTGNDVIDFQSTLDGPGGLTVTTAGLTRLNGAVGGTTALASLLTNGGGAGITQINGGSVRTTGDQTFDDAVALGATTTFTGANGNFNAIDANGFDLILSFTGVTTLNQAPTEVDDLVADNGGSILLPGPITTTGSQTYADAVTLGANVTLTSTDNEAIGLLSTVNGGFDLVVTTAGLTTFGGLVGGATALTSVLTNGGGTTAINGGGVITTGAQTYADAVTIGASAGLVSSGNAPILFGATVDGPGALTVNTGGLTRFVGEVGRTTALAALTTNGGGTTALDGGFARATGAQTFNDAVTSTNDIALDAGSVNALSLTAADDIAIRSGGLVDVDTLTSGANPDTDGGAGTADMLAGANLLGNDIDVVAGSVDFVTATASENGAGSDLRVQATSGNLALTTGTAGANVVLSAAGSATGTTITAQGGSATISAGPLAGFDTVDAGGSVSVGAGSTLIGSSTATNGALSLTASSGQLTLGTGSAGTTATISKTGGTGELQVTTLTAGTAAASTGNITIQSTTNARLGDIESLTGSIAVSAAGEVTGIGAGARADLTALTIGRDVSVFAGNLARLGTVMAGRDILVDATGSVDVSTADADNDIAISGATLAAGTLTAGDDIAIRADGAVMGTTFTSGANPDTDGGTGAADTLTAANLLGNDIDVTGGSLALGTATANENGAGSDLRLQATAGDLTITTGVAGTDATLIAAGSATGDTITALGGSAAISAGPLAGFNGVDAGGSVSVGAGSTLIGSSTATSGSLTLIASSGQLTLGAGSAGTTATILKTGGTGELQVTTLTAGTAGTSAGDIDIQSATNARLTDVESLNGSIAVSATAGQVTGIGGGGRTELTALTMGEDISVFAGDLARLGAVIAGGDILIEAGNNVTPLNGSVDVISADGTDVAIQATGGSIMAGTIAARDDIVLGAGTSISTSTLTASGVGEDGGTGVGDAGAGGTFDLTGGGNILAVAGNGAITVAGTITGDVDVALAATMGVTTLDITTGDDIVIRAGGAVATGNLTSGPDGAAQEGAGDPLVTDNNLDGNDIDIAGTSIAVGAVRANGVGSDVRLRGPVTGSGPDLDIRAGGDIVLGGLASARDVALQAGGLVDTQDIVARDDIAIRAVGSVDTGALTSGAAVAEETSISGAADTLLGAVIAGHDIDLRGSAVSVSQATTIANPADLLGAVSDLRIEATSGRLALGTGSIGGTALLDKRGTTDELQVAALTAGTANAAIGTVTVRSATNVRAGIVEARGGAIDIRTGVDSSGVGVRDGDVTGLAGASNGLRAGFGRAALSATPATGGAAGSDRSISVAAGGLVQLGAVTAGENVTVAAGSAGVADRDGAIDISSVTANRGALALSAYNNDPAKVAGIRLGADSSGAVAITDPDAADSVVGTSVSIVTTSDAAEATRLRNDIVVARTLTAGNAAGSEGTVTINAVADAHLASGGFRIESLTGSIAVTAAGDVTGIVPADDGERNGADAVRVSNLSSGGDLTIGSGGDVRIGTASAGDDLTVTASGSVTGLGSAGSADPDGANLIASRTPAGDNGRDVAVQAQGLARLGLVSATRDVTVSAGAVSIETANAARNLSITGSGGVGAPIAPVKLWSGNDILAPDFGQAMLTAIGPNGRVTVDAGRIAQLGQVRAGDAIQVQAQALTVAEAIATNGAITLGASVGGLYLGTDLDGAPAGPSSAGTGITIVKTGATATQDADRADLNNEVRLRTLLTANTAALADGDVSVTSARSVRLLDIVAARSGSIGITAGGDVTGLAGSTVGASDPAFGRGDLDAGEDVTVNAGALIQLGNAVAGRNIAMQAGLPTSVNGAIDIVTATAETGSLSLSAYAQSGADAARDGDIRIETGSAGLTALLNNVQTGGTSGDIVVGSLTSGQTADATIPAGNRAALIASANNVRVDQVVAAGGGIDIRAGVDAGGAGVRDGAVTGRAGSSNGLDATFNRGVLSATASGVAGTQSVTVQAGGLVQLGAVSADDSITVTAGNANVAARDGAIDVSSANAANGSLTLTAYNDSADPARLADVRLGTAATPDGAATDGAAADSNAGTTAAIATLGTRGDVVIGRSLTASGSADLVAPSVQLTSARDVLLAADPFEVRALRGDIAVAATRNVTGLAAGGTGTGEALVNGGGLRVETLTGGGNVAIDGGGNVRLGDVVSDTGGIAVSAGGSVTGLALDDGGNAIDGAGRLFAGRDVTVTAGPLARISAIGAGTATTGGNVAVTADTIAVGTVDAAAGSARAGDVTLLARGAGLHAGTITADGAVDLETLLAGTLRTPQPGMLGGADADDRDTLDIVHGFANLTAAGAIGVTAGLVSPAADPFGVAQLGTVTAGGGATILADRLTVTDLVAGGALALTTREGPLYLGTGIVGTSATLIKGGAGLAFAGDELRVRDSLVAGTDVTIRSATDARLGTVTATAGTLTVRAGANTAGAPVRTGEVTGLAVSSPIVAVGLSATHGRATLTGGGSVDVEAGGLVQLGQVQAGQNVRVEAGSETIADRDGAIDITSAAANGGSLVLRAYNNDANRVAGVRLGTTDAAGTAVMDTAAADSRAGTRIELRTLGTRGDIAVGQSLIANGAVGSGDVTLGSVADVRLASVGDAAADADPEGVRSLNDDVLITAAGTVTGLVAGGAGIGTAGTGELRAGTVTGAGDIVIEGAGNVRLRDVASRTEDIAVTAGGSVTGLATADTVDGISGAGRLFAGRDVRVTAGDTARVTRIVSGRNSDVGATTIAVGRTNAGGNVALTSGGTGLHVGTSEAGGATTLRVRTAGTLATPTAGDLGSASGATIDTLATTHGAANLDAQAAGKTVAVTAGTDTPGAGSLGAAQLGTVAAGAGTGSATGNQIAVTADRLTISGATADNGAIVLTSREGPLFLGTGSAGTSATLTKNGAGDGVGNELRVRTGLTAGTATGGVGNVGIVTATDARLANVTGRAGTIDVTAARDVTGIRLAANAIGRGGDLAFGAANLSTGGGTVGLDVNVTAGELAQVGTVAAGRTVNIASNSVELTGAMTATEVNLTNRAARSNTTRLGGTDTGNDNRTGLYVLREEELNRISADRVNIDSGSQNLELQNVALTANVGRTNLRLLTTGRADVTGTLTAAGSPSTRTIQIGGARGAANPQNAATLASVIAVTPGSTGGGRLLAGGANLDLRGGFIGVGLANFISEIGLNPGGAPASNDTINNRFVADPSSTLYVAGLGVPYQDKVFLTANNLSVSYTNYALFQNTVEAISGLIPTGVEIGGLNVAPALSLGSTGVGASNSFALFGVINGQSGNQAALLGPNAIPLNEVNRSNSRINGCLIGSGGGGCLVSAVTTPPLNEFDDSSADILQTAEDLEDRFDPIVGTNNEALFTGISSIDELVEPEIDCETDPENAQCPAARPDPAAQQDTQNP